MVVKLENFENLKEKQGGKMGKFKQRKKLEYSKDLMENYGGKIWRN